jgi:hypothetical protein
VRGHWSGRERSLCGHRGAPGRGDACGGRDEAGGGPEWPAHSGVPGGEEEGGLSGGRDQRLWIGHTSRKSAEWSERCAGPVRSSWKLKRGRSRGVLSPMAGGIAGRCCARTERAEAGSRALRGGEIGLASTTAHGRQWIGTASACGQRRVEHGVERVGVGGRWRLVPLTCGPSGLFEFPMIFNHSNFEIQNGDLTDVQNSLNFA